MGGKVALAVSWPCWAGPGNKKGERGKRKGASWASPNEKRERGKRAGGDDRANRPNWRERSESENNSSFFKRLSKYNFQNVYEYLLNFDSNQSSQRYLCNSMHA
jgi:hypothetical protein